MDRQFSLSILHQEAKPRHHNIGLGYHHTIQKEKPWLTINMISSNPLPLELIHLKLVDSNVSLNEILIDLFPSKESLKEF